MKKIINKIKEFFKKPKVKKVFKIIGTILGSITIAALGHECCVLKKDENNLRRIMLEEKNSHANTLDIAMCYYDVLESKRLAKDAEEYRKHCFSSEEYNVVAEDAKWWRDEFLPCTYKEWKENIK